MSLVEILFVFILGGGALGRWTWSVVGLVPKRCRHQRTQRIAECNRQQEFTTAVETAPASGRGSPSKYKTRLTVRFPVFNFPPLLTVTGRAGCPSSSLSSLSDAASYLGTPIRVGELPGAFITDSAAVVSMPSSANCSATSGDLACAAETTARDHRSRANVCRGPISASPAVTSGMAHMVMS